MSHTECVLRSTCTGHVIISVRTTQLWHQKSFITVSCLCPRLLLQFLVCALVCTPLLLIPCPRSHMHPHVHSYQPLSTFVCAFIHAPSSHPICLLACACLHFHPWWCPYCALSAPRSSPYPKLRLFYLCSLVCVLVLSTSLLVKNWETKGVNFHYELLTIVASSDSSLARHI